MRGRLTVNVVNSPDDAAEIVLPWARTIDLVMASPRPQLLQNLSLCIAPS